MNEKDFIQGGKESNLPVFSDAELARAIKTTRCVLAYCEARERLFGIAVIHMLRKELEIFEGFKKARKDYSVTLGN